ncbi:MAG TPA: putative toxin-antitoxin system toxin component, PIN family [Candidatus Acidoferrum sp.]|nr:putative toxin-antitoxin system toxin component, PIN family [Candidatus Acidoferrum sp.]
MPSLTKQEPKVVLDTNVWISAFLWGGKPAEIIKAAEQNRLIIFASEEIVVEISQVLTYPKIRSVYQGTELSRETLIQTVMRIAKFVRVTKKLNVVQEHSADNKFVECALASGADYIVSGDKHLLKVACYKKTQIVSVKEFLKQIETNYSSKDRDFHVVL